MVSRRVTVEAKKLLHREERPKENSLNSTPLKKGWEGL